MLLTEVAVADLDQLIRTHSLPADTRERVRQSLAPLERFARLAGRWQDYRFILGPWRWMIVVYHRDDSADLVAIVTIQDGRASSAPTAQR